MGFFRRATKPLRWFARGHVEAVKAGVNPYERRFAHEIIRNSTSRIKQHLKDLHANRDPNAPGAPDLNNFDEVLEHWGITREQLPKVIQVMKVQIFIYFIFGLGSFYGLYFGYKTNALFPIISAALILFMSIVVVVCRYWRVQVLECERFFFFKDWILGRA
ncbi:hypothetical protein [Desulfuromonas sp. AOP6]|uniref:hypothetical protein n=1 Tax=Desulfuromonas sp. AOP6 TaxID=1566351 RepID=UPI00127F49E4|nr:hypothetical protein [Desulfuromonas sp. AOP6]BCA80306.1 hypothetical protein AOP6_2093 [Desulfuromonas sp. AOP6]